MTLRCISWIAVSSRPQTEKESPHEQRSANQSVIEQLGGTLVAELEVPGESREIISFEAACDQIDAYARLKGLISARAADVLVCRDLSRLGRTQALIAQIVAYCHAAGIAIYPRNAPPSSTDANEQIANDGSSILLAIQASLAEIDLRTFQRRHEYGMAGRVKGGKFPRGAPYGWQEVNGKYELDEQAAKTIRMALLELYLYNGMTMSEIAEELTRRGRVNAQGDSDWTRGMIYNFLKQLTRYAGYVELNKQSKKRNYIKVRGDFPAILTDDEHDEIARERAQRAASRRAARHYLFSRACRCDRCGHNMHYQNHSKDPYVYLCCGHGCTNGNYVREEKLLESLYTAIDYLQDDNNLADILAQSTPHTDNLLDDIQAHQEQLESIAEQRQRLTLAYTTGTLDADEYQTLMDGLRKKRSAIESYLEQLQARYRNAGSQADRTERIKAVRAQGRGIVDNPDIPTEAKNAWLRRHFRFWLADARVVRVEFL